jgi:hypothetical protein
MSRHGFIGVESRQLGRSKIYCVAGDLRSDTEGGEVGSRSCFQEGGNSDRLQR